MITGQTGVFIDSEGNNWYRRNRVALERFDPATDPVLQVLRQFGVRPRSAIEVGASNGFRIASIVEQSGCRGVAVEPSSEAIADGRVRYSRVEFVQGAAHDVAVRDIFDLVIVNFVLHWVDRSLLLRSAAEIDRLVADGGFLVIGDFAPANPTRVPYHHLPDQQVFTYKQDYGGLFVASGLYKEVGSVSFSHGVPAPSMAADDAERTKVTLLRKALEEYYVKPSTPPSRHV